MRYNQEKERLDSIRKLQVKRQELQVALMMAEQRNDLARVADIRYGRRDAVREGLGGLAVTKADLRPCDALSPPPALVGTCPQLRSCLRGPAPSMQCHAYPHQATASADSSN